MKLNEKLTAVTLDIFSKVPLFINSGIEVVANAAKIPPYYSRRQAIIAFRNGFHDRALLTMSLAGNDRPYKVVFSAFTPKVYHKPYVYC